MQAHQVLNIELEKLKKANNEAIGQAFLAAKEALDAIRIIEVEELARKKKELADAYNELNTQEKRNAYVQKHEQKMDSTIVLETPKGTSSSLHFFSSGNSADITAAYQKYIDQKIQNLNPSEPDFKEKKEKLEANKIKAAPQHKTYNSVEEWQKSPHYESLDEEEKKNYSAKSFPRRTVVIVLTFDSFEEALDFVKANQGIDEARKMADKIQKKGLPLDPDYARNLTSKAEDSEEECSPPRPGRRF